MVFDKGSRCAKACVIIFTLLFWATGFALLTLGILMLVDPKRNYVLDLVNFSDDEPLLKFAAYSCLAAGSVTLVVGFLGCCGALKSVRCMLAAFVLFLLFLFLAELTIGVLALIFKDKFSGDFMPRYLHNLTHNRYYRDRWVTPLIDTVQHYIAMNLKTDLKRLMQTKYGIVTSAEESPYNEPTVTIVIDKLQFYLECCGSTGPSDWAESGWRTEAATNGEDAGLVPITCCTQLDGATARNPIAKSFGRCQQPDASREWRHLEGCHAKLQEWFDFHSIIFIAVGFGFAAFQLIGIVASICLCRQIKDHDYSSLSRFTF